MQVEVPYRVIRNFGPERVNILIKNGSVLGIERFNHSMIYSRFVINRFRSISGTKAWDRGLPLAAVKRLTRLPRNCENPGDRCRPNPDITQTLRTGYRVAIEIQPDANRILPGRVKIDDFWSILRNERIDTGSGFEYIVRAPEAESVAI